MPTIADRVNDLEKSHIECSTALNGRIVESEKTDKEIAVILAGHGRKIDALPWKIFGIVGGTITLLLTVCVLVFNLSMRGIQEQYETFTSQVITLEIRNLDNKINRLHSPKRDREAELTSFPNTL